MQYVRVAGSNTCRSPCNNTQGGPLLPTEGVFCILGVVVKMAQQVAVADGATGGAYVAIVYSENSCKGDVCLIMKLHMNTLECSFVVHHQLQSQGTDQNEYSAMSCIPYVMYIRMCALSQWLHIQPYMSGLYRSTAVVVGCAVLLYGYGVWSLPK